MRLIDADAFSEQYGNYYAEEGPEEGFIGTVGELIAKQPTIESEPVRHGRWIPCSERLPETDTTVICYMRSGQILVMELSDDDGWYCGITRYNPRAVTHWMPLPEPPKE
ncbi:MAG: DUF551 domain-containing protein [Oscillospiraceae bacterium]|nr:DUF551 domain-containing protein [Oscillospiraceae bacterium]